MDANRSTGLRSVGDDGHPGATTNGRGEPPPPTVGGDDMGLDQLLAQVGGRRLLPGPEAARLLLGLARRPPRVARRATRLAVGLKRAAAGSPDWTPPKGDRRFSDPAWVESWLFRRLAQGYLTIADEARGLIEDAELDWKSDQQLRLVVDNLIDALAPTNFPWSNPTAIKAAIDQGGRNFVVGARQLARDMSSAPRIPANVDKTAFVVGETVAATPGAVVARQPKFELLQYQPVTTEVREVPVVFIPPMISKFYCVDLSPGRSLIEYLVARGQQVFTISWKNSTKKEAHWDFDSYMEAIIDALKLSAAVCSTDRVHVAGLCLGGIMSTCAVAHLAEIGEQDLVAGLTLNVTVLDTERAGPVPAVVSPATAALATASSRRQGYLAGTELATTFAWLRPNEMIWNNVVNNYLLGKKPPAFDLLFWNADSQNMPAAAHRDLVEFGLANPLPRAGDADRRVQDHGGRLRGRCRDRPSHAVAELLPDRGHARGRHAFRALEQRSHRRDHQSARQPPRALPRRRRVPAERGGLAGVGREETGHVVGGLGRVARPALGSAQGGAQEARQPAAQGARSGAGHLRSRAVGGVATP